MSLFAKLVGRRSAEPDFGTHEANESVPQDGFHVEYNDETGGYDEYEDGENVFSHSKWLSALDDEPVNPDSESI